MSLSVPIGLLGWVAAGTGAVLIWTALRTRSTPEKRERARRLTLGTTGRWGDALLTEVADDALYYTYSVRGVQYEASQDVSSLRDRLPSDAERMVGPVGMKYASNNPANSILLSEEWSGLREPSPRPATASVVLANSNGVGHQTEDAALAKGSQR